ncbi:uncharacterized protein LOC119432994 isoform X2 [Dermacentor silvarum]|uniref:uncharacterized protein LOC119432994 isoform X2 n=1 Tax=Dermacentor silvarum TaxID=543639 RepID=UPI002101C50C|nr:uncharacterized protein LOC119432994 isoform X2 [Dermacentor silvarum]
MVYLVLILVFSLAKESFGSGIKASSDSNKPSLTTLFQALDTSQKIWMKMHNYAVEAVSCFYYGKILLRHNVYDFDEYYTKGDPSWSPQKKKNFMTATLSEGTDGPVMWVRPRASKDDRCEQIVWGSVVRANATSCNEAYKTICGTKRYNEYKESCGI